MRITIETIPHSQQRYSTCGDWIFDAEGNLDIKVSTLGVRDMEILVGLHELIEAVLCYDSGVSEQEVSDFDIMFEKNRKEGDESEPGDHPKAPYRFAHQAANRLERMAARLLDVPWDLYEKRIQELFEKETRCGKEN